MNSLAVDASPQALANHSLFPSAASTQKNSARKGRRFDIREEQQKHSRFVESALGQFRRYENKHERAYARIARARKLPTPVPRRVFDGYCLESIVVVKNGRWRDELARGTDPYEIVAPVSIRLALPLEKNRARRTRTPVFFWG
jgi:hypothetical protein